ncbi:hypothetical protein SFC76_14330 [Sphingomonas sp. CD22]|jgi:hypothetical protein|nr:hypothetical protein [Sphingomonas sp. CD22]MEA1085440.1 hypothetical protein [Sphingomonas sp. CD22]
MAGQVPDQDGADGANGTQRYIAPIPPDPHPNRVPANAGTQGQAERR